MLYALLYHTDEIRMGRPVSHWSFFYAQDQQAAKRIVEEKVKSAGVREYEIRAFLDGFVLNQEKIPGG